MHDFDIKRLDLNLLLTLHVLLQECSVSQAAQRLSLSQSAVSHALGRLREHLGDPLFIRKSHGMVPTPRARELAGPLRQVLANIEHMLGPSTFDPYTAKGSIRLVMADYGLAIVMPQLLKQLAREAPKLNVECHDWSEHTLEYLKTGFVDLALGGQERFEGYRTGALFEERFVSVVRQKHPILSKQLTVHSYVQWDHALVDVVDSRMRGIDKQLEQQGLKRRVLLKLPHFLAAPLIVASSDMIVTLPERVAQLYAKSYKLTIIDSPIDLGNFPYRQVWHERSDNDPLHQWLRNLLKEQCRSL